MTVTAKCRLAMTLFTFLFADIRVIRTSSTKLLHIVHYFFMIRGLRFIFSSQAKATKIGRNQRTSTRLTHLGKLEHGIRFDGVNNCNWLRCPIGAEDGGWDDGRSGGVVFFNLVCSFRGRKKKS